MQNTTRKLLGRAPPLKAESVLRIDIREFNREGLLAPGTYGSINYTRQGTPAGSISFKASNDQIILVYGFRVKDSWEDIVEFVNLTWTSCNFGGRRVWFMCPTCKRRVAVLYSTPRRFLCRQCGHLTYSSRCETKIDRLIRRATKIRKRLWGDETTVFDTIMIKPPQMHWKTYWRFREEISRIEFRLIDEMEAVFERLAHKTR